MVFVININIFLVFIGTTLYIFPTAKNDIRRTDRNSFFGGFTRVHNNRKMRDENVLNKYSQLSDRDCAVKCIRDERCASFQLHQYSHACETLNSSISVTRNLLQHEAGWTFFDTDPTYPYNGMYCKEVRPCPSTHICDDMSNEQTPYRCRCEKGFSEAKCDRYIGPGSKETLPAGSCGLLKLKHKKLLSGYYWLKKNNKDEPAKRVLCNYNDEKAARCDFKSTSDGDGTTEDMISYSMTENECMRGCLELKKRKPAVNGITMTHTIPGRCYCEYGMKNWYHNNLYKSCLLVPID